MDALFAWLWQGTAIAMAVALALRGIPRTSAATRHLVWWVTLACVVALPLIPLALVPLAPEAGGIDSSASAPAAPSAWTLPAPPDWLIALALGAWLGIVTLASVRIVRGVLHVRRLARQAERMPAGRESALPLWRAHRQIGRATRLRVSTNVTMPCALGLGPATILVPRDMLARLDDEDLDKVVMHERAHLARYDDWTRLLQAIVTAVVGLHPAVQWIGRQLDVERETACDDLVVQATGDARAYASCLAEVASAAAASGMRGTPALASGAMRSAGCLERRVRRLIDRRHNGTTAPSRRFTLAVAAGLAVTASAFVQTTPVVTFVRGAAADDVSVADVLQVAPAAVAARDQLQPATPPGPVVSPPASDEHASPNIPAADPKPSSRRRQEPATDAQPATIQHVPSSDAASSRPGAPPEQFVELPAALSVDVGVRPTLVDANSRSGVNPPEASGERSPWSGVAQAGATVGTGAKKAGVAVAGFFSRAGQAVGSSF